ncbi:hypothetical protein Rhopal_004709-T1 [Rhodotorula paludigena]|uniref:Magnesium transporter NIPA-domain-containing protein n=1 Tax=Rhodotorula paludigena TaxID=86838 RepID=A0AAV5GGK1_9BASI|nr:hypothetical protein Rhopal_004709-T1 [Rhodotorula paludigena]
MATAPADPHIPIAAGIVVGLGASFVQSLGLTLQRSSHIANEQLAPQDRKRDWQRPRWLCGFAIFILSNVFGTLFQIGALPIVVLGPLGAVSLLWNALFARYILGDEFTVQLAAGSVLIAGGATLIGIFGVVPEQTHTLPQLLALYRRPAFAAWIASLALALLAVLATAHLSEWRAARRAATAASDEGDEGAWKMLRRRRSRSTRHEGPALERSASSDERAPLLPRHSGEVPSKLGGGRKKGGRPGPLQLGEGFEDDDAASAVERDEAEQARSERTRMWLAVAYGATSGTLSGVCLLITKTGIDLIISSITSGKNQLSYLNRALRLVGPTLVCPLAFCFYNTASILSGLIFYRQADALAPLQGAMIALGCAVLLAGVWVVSVKPPCRDREERTCAEREEDAAWSEEPEDALLLQQQTDDEPELDDEPVIWRPRGFSIGIGAASPGFDIRPAHLHRAHTSHHPPPGSPSPSADLAASTASLPVEGRHGHAHGHAHGTGGRRRHGHGHGRSESLSGSLYVGPPPASPAGQHGHARTGSLPVSPAGEAREDEPSEGGGGWFGRWKRRSAAAAKRV